MDSKHSVSPGGSQRMDRLLPRPIYKSQIFGIWHIFSHRSSFYMVLSFQGQLIKTRLNPQRSRNSAHLHWKRVENNTVTVLVIKQNRKTISLNRNSFFIYLGSWCLREAGKFRSQGDLWKCVTGSLRQFWALSRDSDRARWHKFFKCLISVKNLKIPPLPLYLFLETALI